MERRRPPEIAHSAGMGWKLLIAVVAGWIVLTGVPTLIHYFM